MEKEFEELKKENSKLRNAITFDLESQFDEGEIKQITHTINKLVENEIQQEKHCNI